MGKNKLFAVVASAAFAALLMTGCDDPGEPTAPGPVEETEFDDNNGIDDDLADDANGNPANEQASDVATEPSE